MNDFVEIILRLVSIAFNYTRLFSSYIVKMDELLTSVYVIELQTLNQLPVSTRIYM